VQTPDGLLTSTIASVAPFGTAPFEASSLAIWNGSNWSSLGVLPHNYATSQPYWGNNRNPVRLIQRAGHTYAFGAFLARHDISQAASNAEVRVPGAFVAKVLPGWSSGFASPPQNRRFVQGETVTIAAQPTESGGGYWMFNNQPLSNGGSVSGANTPMLMLTNAGASRVGQYLYVANLDGCVSRSNLSVPAAATWGPVTLSIAPVCDSVDFNNDGSVFDPQDVEAFLSYFSEGPCVPVLATCNDVDFNNDGSLFDPQDVDAFFSVFSEGPCL
jgi:hypothetical protein